MPSEVIAYLVVHELAHVHIRNHSADYWTKVEQMMPDYLKYDNLLKEYDHILSIFKNATGVASGFTIKLYTIYLKNHKSTFDRKAIDIIVKQAVELKLGARGLRSVCEAVMLDAMFEFPSDKSKKKLIITQEYVNNQLGKISLNNLKAA